MRFIVIMLLCGIWAPTYAQVLPLPDALQHAIQHYERIKAKAALVKAAKENTTFQGNLYLPDFTVQAQQNYGTINALNGPLYSYGGLGAAATSMPLAEQNWHAAFGSLYLANVNWSIFTFGKLKHQLSVARSNEKVAADDLEQEKFQHQVKVGAAYLNLLAAQRVKYVQEKNLERANVFFTTTDSRARSGLIPGVNVSLAKAEVSSVESARIKAYDMELEYSKTLAVLLGEEFKTYQLDSLFTTRIPVLATSIPSATNNHPLLIWQKGKVEKSGVEERLKRSQGLPSLSAFGVLQGRGSGFDWNYVQNNTTYSKSYFDGVGINRSNYVLGVALSWNITGFYRHSSKIREQKFITSSLQHEYNLMNEELTAQGKLADAKIKNALENFEQTKIQVKAANDAYRQNTTLYNTGLTTIVDFTQSLYALNHAEIDFEIAQNNVWQALLIKAAAAGDLNILLNAIN